MAITETERTTGLDQTRVGAHLPAPLLFGGGLILGLLLHRTFPFTLIPRGLARAIGAFLFVPGIMLGGASVRAMRRVGTSPNPRWPTRALATSGPYRYTRNPIYLSMALMYSGISFLANAIWPLLLLPTIVALVDRRTIKPEEAYLEGRFGESYRRYKEDVRRWL